MLSYPIRTEGDSGTTGGCWRREIGYKSQRHVTCGSGGIRGKSIDQLGIDGREGLLEVLGGILQRGIGVLDHQGVRRGAISLLGMGVRRQPMGG